METKLIDGKNVRANDEKILASLKKNARDGGGNTMSIGIRNESGQIYRAVQTVGMGEFMAVIDGLFTIGLTDELANVSEMREGCDAIFS